MLHPVYIANRNLSHYHVIGAKQLSSSTDVAKVWFEVEGKISLVRIQIEAKSWLILEFSFLFLLMDLSDDQSSIGRRIAIPP